MKTHPSFSPAPLQEHVEYHFLNRLVSRFMVEDETEDCVLLTNQRLIVVTTGLVSTEVGLLYDDPNHYPLT